MSKVKKFFFEPLKFWNDYFTKRFNYKAERGYLKTNKKNLIYFCFNDSGNFLLSKLLLLTLNNFEKNYEILIICSSKHIDDQNIEKYCVDNNLDFFLVNEDDPYFLRYRIFDWEKINNFEKIFYIDCDVIFNESPKYLFEKCIKAFNIAYHDYGKIFLLKEIKKPSPGWFGADVALKENFKFPDNWKIYGSGQFVFKNNETIKKLFSDILYYKNIIGKTKYKYNFKGKYFPFGDQPLLNYFLAKNEIDFDDNILTKHASFNVTKNKSLFIHYLDRNKNKIFKILNIVKKQNFSKEKFNDFSNEDLFLISILADKKNIFINDLQNKNTNFENLLKISNFLPNLNIFTTTERAKIYNFYVRNKIKVYICSLNDEFLENFDVAFIDSLDFSGFFNVIKNTKLIILNIEKKNNLDHLYREMLANELFEEINLKYENFDTKNLNNKYYQKNKNSNLSESLIKMFKSSDLKHQVKFRSNQIRLNNFQKYSELIEKKFGQVIAYGEFKGLILNFDSWGRKYKLNKIFGLYEWQVTNKIKTILQKYNYNILVNLGADNGYYPLGFLKTGLVENAIAFESIEKTKNMILENAKINKLENKIRIFGHADKNFLNLIKYVNFKKCIFLIDIEGAEYDLFDKQQFSNLKNSSIVIEDHSNRSKDMQPSNFDNALIDFANDTHDCEIIYESIPSIAHIKEIINFPDDIKYSFLSEGRACQQRWLIFTPKNDYKGIFTSIYNLNKWGNTETRSGPGSTIIYTKELLKQLPVLLKTFDIKSIIDAPCGDLNYMKEILPKLNVDYTGADIVEELIKKLQNQYTSNRIKFINLDITSQKLPEADLMICRDCLFHFDPTDVVKFFKNFAASNIKYLLTTTHINSDKNFKNVKNLQTGKYHKIDLFSEPYNLPREVLFRINDYIKPHSPREMVLFSLIQIKNRFF